MAFRGLGHFRHESHENPATELAKLPAIQAIPWHLASCPNQDDMTGPVRRADYAGPKLTLRPVAGASPRRDEPRKVQLTAILPRRVPAHAMNRPP